MSDFPAPVNPPPLETPYAEVAVDVLNVPADQTYHYAVPAHLRERVAPGVMVLVGFGERIIEGLVVAGAEESPVPLEDIREIMDVVADGALLTPAQIALARRIARYYFASPMKVIGPMLPPGLRGSVRRWSKLDPQVPLPEDIAKTESGQLILSALREGDEVSHKKLAQLVGSKEYKPIQRRLERAGAVHVRVEVQAARPPSLREQWVESLAGLQDAETLLRRSRSQRRLMQALEDRSRRAPVDALLRETGGNLGSLRRLKEKGLVRFGAAHQIRLGHAPAGLPTLDDPAEARAWEAIAQTMTDGDSTARPRRTVVMVNSSPEQLYCHAAARTLAAGGQVLLLTPNPATARRVAGILDSALPGAALEWHEALRTAKRRTTWERVYSRDPVVVVGTRTAVFLPFQQLGLILVDSEHEDYYKNPEIPRSDENVDKNLKGLRFHAVTVAEWLSEQFGAPLLLFSHTPRVTTYAEVESGNAQFVRAADVTPTARIIDMRAARHVGPRQLISRELRDAVAKALDDRRPVVLLQNRRGAATHALCPACGHVVECRNCSVPLVQHRASGVMRCHRCGAEAPIPKDCPVCAKPLRFRGVGAQAVELEMQRILPDARIARWDSDVISAKEGTSPFAALREGKLGILIGTAAVLREPLPVALYAVVSADTALHLPDFRASERTYQLLRRIGFMAAAAGADFLVQTYTPESLPLRALKVGRYLWFYRKSMEERAGAFPPSVAMAVLLYQDRNAERAAEAAVALVQCLQEATARDGPAVELLGPAPAFPERVRGLYRWHVIVRGKDIHRLLVHVPAGWTIDVDPVSVL